MLKSLPRVESLLKLKPVKFESFLSWKNYALSCLDENEETENPYWMLCFLRSVEDWLIAKNLIVDGRATGKSELIVSLFQSGTTKLSTLAKETGVSRVYLYKVLKDRGLK